jgi:ethanolamine utilization protein EutA (predicted chaperonin)
MSFSETFDIMPTPVEKLPVVKEDNTIEQDSFDARDNLRSLIKTASSALENALSVAIQSESPRAYEVVANLINTAADLNTKLLNTHNIQQKATPQQAVNAQQNNTTNNVIFNGTTSELARLLEGKL